MTSLIFEGRIQDQHPSDTFVKFITMVKVTEPFPHTCTSLNKTICWGVRLPGEKMEYPAKKSKSIGFQKLDQSRDSNDYSAESLKINNDIFKTECGKILLLI